MTEVRFTDRLVVSDTRTTVENFLVADVRCARSGCQDYDAAELGFGEGRVTVYRPEDVVFDKQSMATFAGRTVTIGHPAQPVDADTWRDVAVGEVGSEVARDGEFVRVTAIIRDAEAIKEVEAGTRQISMGYSTPVVAQDGIAPDGTPYQAVQTGPIKINHLAIVDVARGGPELRFGDRKNGGETVEQWGASPITVTDKKETPMSDALKQVVLGDKAVPVAAEHVATIEAWKADQAKALADAQTAHTEALAAKDTEIGGLKAKLADAEKLIPDQAALDKMVADRADLVARVKQIAPKVAPAGLSDDALRRAAVEAARGKDFVGDASDAEVRGMFAVVAKDAAADPVVGALRYAPAAPVPEVSDAADAYNAMLNDMSGAWQAPEQKGAN